MSTANKKLSCKKKTAVAYARYSSSSQRDVSIDQQLKDIRAFAEREGYTIVHEYADRAKSGYKRSDMRKEFQEMLRAASAGTFDTIIAWKVDRFGRNRRESAIFKGQLADNGVSVVYAMEPIPEGAAGVLTEGMLEALAEWYSRNLSENIRRGQRDNAIKGICNGNQIRGYKKGPDGHYMIDEVEAPLIRRIFSLYSQGYSAASIANILNDEGVNTSRGVMFRTSTIIFIIQNETYIGVLHYGDVRIENAHPALIDRDTWERCQILRAKTSKHWEKGKTDYLLSGKMKCGLCGSTIIRNSTNGRSGETLYHYYSCANRKERKGCTLKSRRKEDLEKVIFDTIFKKVLVGKRMDQFIDAVTEVLETQQETSPARVLEADLQDTCRKINNINQAIAEGIWTESTGALLKSLVAKSEELKKNIAYQKTTERTLIAPERIQFYIEKIANGKRSDSEYLKTMIGSFINKIVIYEDWAQIALNISENVEMLPPEALPMLENTPDLSCFEFRPNSSSRLVTSKTYPVVIFKIPLKTA